MIKEFFLNKIIEKFEFDLTADQNKAISLITDFLFAPNCESLFLLRGYAGTGKSSLLGALVKTMDEFKQKTLLLAPTGRASKVLSGYAGHPAFTIHKKLYRQQRFGSENIAFSLLDNKHKDTLFIVDEASMISNQVGESAVFGSGLLLDDLISFVYSGENCRLMLIGDSAQLPPVGEEQSPALDKDFLEGYGLQVLQAELKQTVRQSLESGILYNATAIREMIETGIQSQWPKLVIENFQDLRNIDGNELIEELSSVYSNDGEENCMIISRSNKRANIFNQGVRNSILYREEEISSGDLLMICKNNYYWSEKIENLDFLANGQIIEVLRVRSTQELYGFRFCDLLVRNNDLDMEFEIKIILDSLHSESAGLTRERNQELFYKVMEDYEDVRSRSERIKKLKTDPFYNAVQVKFAYAVTCHKAQGGEWQNVFLDMGPVPEAFLGIGFYRWLYTAFTRATKKLYLINLPKEFL